MDGYTDDPTLGLTKILGAEEYIYTNEVVEDVFNETKRHLIIPEDIPNFRNDVKTIYFEVANSRPNQQLGYPPSINEIVEIIDEENFDFIDMDLTQEQYDENFIEAIKLKYIISYSKTLPDKVRTQLINMGLIFTEKQVFEGDLYHEKIGIDQGIVNPKILYSDWREYRKYEREKTRSICDR